MGSNPSRHAVCGLDPLAGERAIAAELSRQTRQDKSRPDVGKEADPDLGHGKAELVAGHAMGTVDRNADPAPHDDAIDERHIRLGVMLDAGVERVFLAKIAERLVVASCAPEIVERAQISARGERAGVIRGDDNAAHAWFPLPFRELPRQLAHHRKRYRIERMRPIERDETRRTPSFEQEIVRPHALAHK